MSSVMRAKFVVSSVEKSAGGEKIIFNAVARANPYPDDGSDEDNTYAKWTPTASCEIHVANPALHGKFEPGQKFYVDFTEAG